MVIKVIIGSFLISWVFIIYEIITAPTCDEYGNIINKTWVFIIYEIITAPTCDEYGNIINKTKKQKQKQK